MYINYMITVSIDEGTGDFPEKACQHDQINTRSLQFIRVGIAPEEFFLVDQQGRDFLSLRDVECASPWFVANDERNPGHIRMTKMIDDLLSVGAGTGSENTDFFHATKIVGSSESGVRTPNYRNPIPDSLFPSSPRSF